MRKLDLSAVSGTVRFPMKGGTPQFLQDAYIEIFKELFQYQIGSDYTAFVPYIIYGCKKTVGASNTTISKGLIFFNGEYYTSPSQTFANPSGGNVVIANFKTDQYTGNGVNADPVLFSDGVSRDVHDIITVEWTTGASGSGDFGDYSVFVDVNVWVDAGTLSIGSQAGTLTYSPANVIINRYKILGRNINWNIRVDNLVLSGSSSGSFAIVIPSSITNKYKFNQFGIQTGYLGTYPIYLAFGVSWVGPNDLVASISRIDGSNIPTGTYRLVINLTEELFDI